jgi:hypothetical protein
LNRHLESFHRLTRYVSAIESGAVFALDVLVATTSLFVPISADAAQAMFRVERAWHGYKDGFEPRIWSRGLEPSSMQPPAISTK